MRDFRVKQPESIQKADSSIQLTHSSKEFNVESSNLGANDENILNEEREENNVEMLETQNEAIITSSIVEQEDSEPSVEKRYLSASAQPFTYCYSGTRRKLL